MKKPKGKSKVVAAENMREPNNLAVYARVIVEDEGGNKFYFDAASFYFDLQPYIESKGESSGNQSNS